LQNKGLSWNAKRETTSTQVSGDQINLKKKGGMNFSSYRKEEGYYFRKNTATG